MTAILEARSVAFAVDKRLIVKPTSLTLEEGTLTVLVGPNGAGKTTLLCLLTGELQPSQGVVMLDGMPLSRYSLKELARRRAVLPQATALSFPFTALQVTMMGRWPHSSGRSDSPRDHEVARAAMRRTGVDHLETRSYPTLSGGEQSRVGMARTLAQETPILFLDEPTAHMDPLHQHGVLRTARALTREGATVLAILHDLNLAVSYADVVAVMAAGQMVAVGPPREILDEALLETVFGLPFQRLSPAWFDCPFFLPQPGDDATMADLVAH